MAAPTWKFEYGAWAFFITFFAACSSFIRMAVDDLLCFGKRVLKAFVRSTMLCVESCAIVNPGSPLWLLADTADAFADLAL